MRRVNIADAKAHLSEYLREVKNGETVVICERNVPIARLLPLEEESERKPLFGTMRDRLWVAQDAFDPMTDAELTGGWEGPVFPIDGD